MQTNLQQFATPLYFVSKSSSGTLNIEKILRVGKKGTAAGAGRGTVGTWYGKTRGGISVCLAASVYYLHN